MAVLLMLTSEPGGSSQVLEALALLPHRVRVVPLEPSALLDAPDSDIVLVDGRRDLARARSTCQLMRSTGIDVPLLLVITEGGLPVVGMDWGMDDVVLATAGPAEVDARLRLAADRGRTSPADDEIEEIEAGELRIDSGGYTARLRGEALDLTYKEFELLKYLSQHPGRVFTRAQLLQEVWGYDYFGGTRTVDVHVRRLRAKLGPEHDSMIGTVRNVGYRFESPRDRRDRDAAGSVGSNATATGVARSATGAGAGAAGSATGAGTGTGAAGSGTGAGTGAAGSATGAGATPATGDPTSSGSR